MFFSNLKIKDSVKLLFEASAAIQTYVAAILHQGDIQIDVLPDLPQYQQTARQHAQVWLSQIQPDIIKTNADIIDFANEFVAFYNSLITLARKIDAGDHSASEISKFRDGLGLLRNHVDRKEGGAKIVQIKLQDFRSKLSEDHDHFNEEAAVATKKLEGDDGELKKISSEIEAINSHLDDLIGAIAGGAVGTVGGIIVILVGAYAEFQTAGLSTGLIVAGTGTILGGIGAAVGSGVEYGLAVEHRKELQEKLAGEKQGIGALKHVKGLLDGFVGQSDAALRSAGVLQQEWATLSADLDKAIADLDRDPGSLGLVAMLNEAKGDWEEALRLARIMMPSGNMAVHKVDNIMDVIPSKNLTV